MRSPGWFSSGRSLWVRVGVGWHWLGGAEAGVDQAADQGDARLLNGRALGRLVGGDCITAGQLVVPLCLGQLFANPHVVDFEVGGCQIEHRSVLPGDFCLAGASLAMHASWGW